MKILFENYFDSATLSSVNASLNYPIENLQDSFLHTRYQSSIDVDTITAYFAEDVSISDFFWGFTNATKLILRLYDYENVLLFSITINNPDPAIDGIEFDTIDDVDHAELYIEGLAVGTYLGGIGIGLCYIMLDPLSAWEEPDYDNSDFDESSGGQTLQNYVRPLRGYSLSFTDIPREITDEIMTLYRSVGIGKPLWVDITELAHDFVSPIYGKIMSAISPRRNGRRYDFDITIKEAR